MAPMVWSWHTPVVEVTVATADPVTDRSGDATVRGQLMFISGDLPLVRDLAISLNPGGSTFMVGLQGLLLSWHAGSGEVQGKAELESPSEGPLFFYQVVSSSLLTRAAVVAVVPPEVSQVGREHSPWRPPDEMDVL